MCWNTEGNRHQRTATGHFRAAVFLVVREWRQVLFLHCRRQDSVATWQCGDVIAGCTLSASWRFLVILLSRLPPLVSNNMLWLQYSAYFCGRCSKRCHASDILYCFVKLTAGILTRRNLNDEAAEVSVSETGTISLRVWKWLIRANISPHFQRRYRKLPYVLVFVTMISLGARLYMRCMKLITSQSTIRIRALIIRLCIFQVQFYDCPNVYFWSNGRKHNRFEDNWFENYTST